MRSNLHPIFLLAGLFLILSPLSVADGLAVAEPAKYLRLGTTILIVLAWACSRRGMRVGPAGKALVGFVLFFTGSGIWSDLPQWALFHKGMFALTCLSGMALASVVQTADEFRKGLRILGLLAAATAGLAFALFLKNPVEHSVNDRMAIWGINANMIGQTAAPLFILAAHVALNDRSRWRWVLGAGCAIFVIVIVGTGSRAAALMAGLGMLFLLLPFAKRPGVFLGVGLLMAIVLFVAFDVMKIGGADRMTEELTKDTRGGLWAAGIRLFLASPIIGNGWLHWQTRWGSVQNIYLQTLVETGIVGGIWLLCVLLVIGRRWLTIKAWLGVQHRSSEMAYLSAALLAAVLLHGFAESSTFQGTSVGALLLGMGVVLIERTPDFAVRDLTLRERHQSYAREIYFQA